MSEFNTTLFKKRRTTFKWYRVVNRIWHYIIGGSLKLTSTVPLIFTFRPQFSSFNFSVSLSCCFSINSFLFLSNPLLLPSNIFIWSFTDLQIQSQFTFNQRVNILNYNIAPTPSNIFICSFTDLQIQSQFTLHQRVNILKNNIAPTFLQYLYLELHRPAGSILVHSLPEGK